MQGLHVEVRIDAGLFAGDGDLDRVAADARDDVLILDELHGLGEQVHLALIDEAVADAAMDEGRDRPVIDGPLDVVSCLSGVILTWAIHWILPPRSFQYFVSSPMTWSSSRRIAVLMPHCSQSSQVSKTFSSVKYWRTGRRRR